MLRNIVFGLGVSVFTALMCLIPTPVSAQIIVTPETPALPESPLLITSYQVDDGLPSYVQIYNNSTNLVPLDGWVIDVTLLVGEDEVVLPIALDGYLEKKLAAVIGQEGLVIGADAEFSLPADLASLQVIAMALGHEGYAADSRPMIFSPGVRYDLSRTSAGNYTATSRFVATTDAPLIGGGLYQPAVDAPLRVVAIAANARNCGPLEDSDDCVEYIKIQSLAAEPIDLSAYRLRTGYANQSDSINNTFTLSGELGSGDFLTVYSRDDGAPFNLTASGGNVWIQDKYGLNDYAETVVDYKDIGGSSHTGQVWAYDALRGVWDWAKATLSGPNDFSLPEPVVVEPIQTLKPCSANQYRSPETNRCRSLDTVTSSLTPCRADQYRSPETNRCRSLTSATSTLTPCRADQYRSPETNRCRSLTSSTSTLKECAAGQERNPATNRCRAVQSPLIETAFAVEPIKAGTKEFVGWWALGGLSLIGVGYAGWEWRSELRQLISKVPRVGNSRS